MNYKSIKAKLYTEIKGNQAKIPGILNDGYFVTICWVLGIVFNL